MSIIDTLIYDRTQADVDRVIELKTKILTQGLSSLTADEKTEYLSGMKGAYNASDLNRVGGAVSYVAGRLTDIPTELLTYLASKDVADDYIFQMHYDPDSIDVDPKLDWSEEDIPSDTEISKYLSDISTLRGVLTLPTDVPDVPSSLDYFVFTTANDIEYILYVVDVTAEAMKAAIIEKIDLASTAFMYAGEVDCGE